VKEKPMRRFIVAALVLAASLAAAQQRTAAPADAKVYIISPKNGAIVHNPVLVQFGLKGMGIAPAGVKFDNTGHHHLLIDTDAPADLNAPLPATDKIVHFGKGQTETTLTLSPGKHTLQLLLADMNHVPHQPPVISDKITITVE
jgi:ABC-type proline/glycine betaine transport system substrate-binding protein